MALTPTALGDLAHAELPAATEAIGAGDEIATRYARDIRRLVDGVNSESRKASSRAAQLHGDDEMNPAGKARLLSEIPANLMAATSDQLGEAAFNLELVDTIHLGAILRHDGRNDGALREELRNYTANLQQDNAVATLVRLAANPRYSTIMAGPLGDSLGARFNFEPSVLTKTALQALAKDGIGSADQVARSTAREKIADMKRVIGLARGERDRVAEEVKRPPKPAPSQAMI